MSITNVLTDFPYSKRYYLTHPHKFFKEIWYNLKSAFARATKGYAYIDAANMNSYLLHILPPMLRDMANGIAYPGVEPFETYEKWQDWCNSMADVFESLQEENWQEGRNEWEGEYEEALKVLSEEKNLNYTCTHSMTEEEANDICKLYWDREIELWEERDKILQDAFAQLAKNYNYLWI